MKASQPQLPTMPRDFSQPVEVKGSELPRLLAEAKAAGFNCHRMSVTGDTVYRLQFFRLPSAAKAGKQFREPSETTAKARRSCTPASLYEPKMKPVSVSHANQS
jgi:hypothetical protein